MPITQGDFGESMQNASLRPVLEAIDRKMSRVASGGALAESPNEVGEVLTSWAQLVEILALGPAPRLRTCPACKRKGMLEATRCGFCWEPLSSLALEAGRSH